MRRAIDVPSNKEGGAGGSAGGRAEGGGEGGGEGGDVEHHHHKALGHLVGECWLPVEKVYGFSKKAPPPNSPKKGAGRGVAGIVVAAAGAKEGAGAGAGAGGVGKAASNDVVAKSSRTTKFQEVVWFRGHRVGQIEGYVNNGF